MFETPNSKTLVLISHHNFLKMNYLFLLPLTIMILLYIISLIFLLLISPLKITLLTKVLNFFSLLDHMQNTLLNFLLLTLLLVFPDKLFFPHLGFLYVLNILVILLQISILLFRLLRNNPNTTQPLKSHSLHQHQTPANTPPSTYPITTQPSKSQYHQIFPPILLSFNNPITTQPQSHNSQTSFPATLSSSNSSPPLSYHPSSQNPPLNLPHTTLNPPPTSYDPYASLNAGYHNYSPTSFQTPNFPPNPLPPTTSTFPFNPPPFQPPPSVFQMTPSVPFAALCDPIKLFDCLDHFYPPGKHFISPQCTRNISTWTSTT